MKKQISILIILLIIMTGCSKQENVIVEEANTTINNEVSQEQQTDTTTAKKVDKVDLTNKKNIDTANKKNVESTESESTANNKNNDWFSGAINETLKIHLKLDIKGSDVSGTYYYDKYKKNIAFKGDITDNIISLYEKESEANITIVFVSEELIEGTWSDEKNTYPLYLIKEGSKISIPQKPDNNLIKWKGLWKGKDSGYYSSSDISIYPVFNNLIKFDIEAFNGTHSGGFSGLALINNNKAIYKNEDGIEFIISLNEDENIILDTTDYSYSCGMGVGFDSIYTKDLFIKKPSAKEVGLVNTDEQEKIFKNLTGEHYDEFIAYAQYCGEEEDLDEIGAVVRTFGSRGYNNAGIVMIIEEDNTILAMIGSEDGMRYFTNNDKYTTPPKTMKNWCKDKGDVKIIYNTDVLKLIPDGWHVLNRFCENEIVEGDLNKDGFIDKVLILEKNEEKDIFPDRAMMVVLGEKNHTYSILSIAQNAIINVYAGGSFGDPFEGISIDKGILIIGNRAGPRWYSKYKFRFQDNDMYLIGATVGVPFGPDPIMDDAEELDYNLLTGDFIETKVDKDQNVKTIKGNGGKKKLIKLKDFDIDKVEEQLWLKKSIIEEGNGSK